MNVAVRTVGGEYPYAEIISALFATEIGAQSVGLQDNFFDLGGDSLNAENVILAIQNRFSVKLQTAVLLEAPTPLELARLIAPASPHPAQRLIVPVAGSNGGEPLVMIHGVSGSPLFANRFTDAVKKRYALLAVRAMGIEQGESPYPTRDAMVDGYLGGVQAATGRLPFALGGICMGGIIAMEMGRRVHAETGKRPRLILIDPPPLGSYWLRPKPDNAMTPILRFRLEYLVRYRQLVHAVFKRLGLEQTVRGRRARIKVHEKMLFRSLAGFVPPTYPCDVLVLASSEWGKHTINQFRGWHDGNGLMRTVVLPGKHLGFREANMDAIDREIVDFLSSRSPDLQPDGRQRVAGCMDRTA